MALGYGLDLGTLCWSVYTEEGNTSVYLGLVIY